MSSESNRSQTSKHPAEEVLHLTQDEASAAAVQHSNHRNDAPQSLTDGNRKDQQLKSDGPVTSLDDRRDISILGLQAELANDSSSSTSHPPSDIVINTKSSASEPKDEQVESK